jgi:hypothetical protein
MSRSQVRRRATHAVAGVTLLMAFGASPPTGGAQAAGEEGPGAGCGPDLSAARVMQGRNGVDPNSVSAGQARRMDNQLQRRVDALVRRGALRPDGGAKGTRPITIPTHVHVITATNGEGTVKPSQIRAQIRVMNRGFAGRTSGPAARTPFRFKLASTDVSINNRWYFWHLNGARESAAAKSAKRSLHQGGWNHLNIYVAGLGDGLLGYANFPQHKKLKYDGLVLLNESLPGGSAAPYNKGDTATHEIGHWLGLFHTFQRGCKRPGDRVDDTPYQDNGNNIFFCRESDDTCRQPGRDPVHNFMSYGDDPCLDRFTRGQSDRMIATWRAYRA